MNGGSGGIGASGGFGGVAGTAGTGGTPFVCAALQAGPATMVLSFPERHATAPSAVTLDDVTPPRIAIQAFATGGNAVDHDNIQIARFTVDDAAPAGISLEQKPVLVGIESHGWGNLALAPGGLAEIALAWHGDPGGNGRPMFRAVDVPSWTPGPAVDLTQNGAGEAVLDLTPGAGTGPMNVGYAGNGYAVIWRDSTGGSANTTRPVAAVLDPKGQLLIGPHEVSPPADYPGRSPVALWTGTTYLLATAIKTCPPGKSPCVPDSIVVTRIKPASGDLVDDSGIELVHAISVPKGYIAGRPSFAREGSLVYLTWAERVEPVMSFSPRIRTTTLDINGNPLGGDKELPLTPGVELLSRVTTHAANGALTVIWPEPGDSALPASTPGHSRLVVRRIDQNGTVLGTEIPTPLFHDYGPAWLTSRGAPGSLLAVWGARSMTNGYDYTYAAKVDCALAAAATYEAYWGPPAALDRIYVSKADPALDVCFQMELVHPTSTTAYAVLMPQQWAVQGLSVRKGATFCGGSPFTPDSVQATSANGSIDFQGDLPCALDLAFDATFPQTAPWVPASASFNAAQVPVKGGPCGG